MIGYKNTYSFMYNRHKKTLHPMKEVSLTKKSKVAQVKRKLTMHQFKKVQEKIKIHYENYKARKSKVHLVPRR